MSKIIQFTESGIGVFPKKAPIVSFTVTPAEGVTITRSGCYYEPDSGRVVINLHLTAAAGKSGTDIWAYVPEAYRPSGTRSINVTLKKADDVWPTYVLHGNVRSDGGVASVITSGMITLQGFFGEYYI